MDAHHLIKMANQIGQFFAAYPKHEEAVSGIHQHLKRFWEPRMLRALFAHLDAHGEDGMDPLVAQAVQRLRAEQPAREAVAG